MIKIICLGKIKERYLRDAISDYETRLSKYTKLKIIELEDENIDDAEKILSREKDKILKHIEKNDYIVLTYQTIDSFQEKGFYCTVNRCLDNGYCKEERLKLNIQ